MQEGNPYQAPESPVADQLAAGGTGKSYTPAMVAHLRATRPWVIFISILGFLGSGLMVFVGLVLVLMGNWVPDEDLGGIDGAFIGVFYMLMSLLYFIPSVFLWKYGSAISRLLNRGGDVHMEQALRSQKLVWQLVGITILLSIGAGFAMGILAAVLEVLRGG